MQRVAHSFHAEKICQEANFMFNSMIESTKHDRALEIVDVEVAADQPAAPEPEPAGFDRESDLS